MNKIKWKNVKEEDLFMDEAGWNVFLFKQKMAV